VIGLTKGKSNIFYNKKEISNISGVKKMKTFVKTINVPDYPPREKHITIMNAFDELKPGEVMQIVNDHYPRPLQYQFMIERTDQFIWEYLEEGPETWRIAIEKNKYI
jgi:uncharacterized protein (DUF2249 family)